MSEVHQIGERSEEKNKMLLNVSENVCEEICSTVDVEKLEFSEFSSVGVIFPLKIKQYR